MMTGLCSCSRRMYDRFLQKEAVIIGLQPNDTLVDIGSGTGDVNIRYAMACKGIHQILVDTNRQMLNEKNLTRLDNRAKKKARTPYRFSHDIVHNDPDTIPLPSGVYPKVLFRKSLHELNDMDKMIDEAKRILIRHGSLIIIEANPRKPNQSDPGCKKKYLTSGQIQDIITARGFLLVEHQKGYILKSQLSDEFYFNILKFQKP